MVMCRNDDSFEVAVFQDWLGRKHVPSLKKACPSHIRCNDLSALHDGRQVIRNSPKSDSYQMKQDESAYQLSTEA